MKQIFYFSAPWCQHCESLNSTMDRVSRNFSVEKINVDYETDRAKNAKVQSIPTVILTQNGEEIKRFTGTRSYEWINQWINS